MGVKNAGQRLALLEVAVWYSNQGWTGEKRLTRSSPPPQSEFRKHKLRYGGVGVGECQGVPSPPSRSPLSDPSICHQCSTMAVYHHGNRVTELHRDRGRMGRTMGFGHIPWNLIYDVCEVVWEKPPASLWLNSGKQLGRKKDENLILTKIYICFNTSIWRNHKHISPKWNGTSFCSISLRFAKTTLVKNEQSVYLKMGDFLTQWTSGFDRVAGRLHAVATWK